MMDARVRARIETAYQTLFEIAWDVDGRELTEYVAAVKPLRAYLDSLPQGIRVPNDADMEGVSR